MFTVIFYNSIRSLCYRNLVLFHQVLFLKHSNFIWFKERRYSSELMLQFRKSNVPHDFMNSKYFIVKFFNNSHTYINRSKHYDHPPINRLVCFWNTKQLIWAGTAQFLGKHLDEDSIILQADVISFLQITRSWLISFQLAFHQSLFDSARLRSRKLGDQDIIVFFKSLL